MGLNGGNRVGRAFRAICALVSAYSYRTGARVSWDTGVTRSSNEQDPMAKSMPATDTTIVFVDVSSIIHSVLPKPKPDAAGAQISISEFCALFKAQVMSSVAEVKAVHSAVSTTTEFTFFVVMDRYSLRRWFMAGKRRDVGTQDSDRVDLPYEEPPPSAFNLTTGDERDDFTPAELFRNPATSAVSIAGLRSHIRSGTLYSMLFMQELQQWLTRAVCSEPRINYQLVPSAPFDPRAIPSALRCEWVPRASPATGCRSINLSGRNVIDAPAIFHVVADAVASVVMAFHPDIAGGPQTSSIPEADMLIPSCIRRILAARDTTGDARTMSILVHSCDTDMIAALIYVGMANDQMGGTNPATPSTPRRARTQVPIGVIQPGRVYRSERRNLMLLPMTGAVTDWHSYNNLFGSGCDVATMLSRDEDRAWVQDGTTIRVPSPTSRMAGREDDPEELSPSTSITFVRTVPPRIVPFSGTAGARPTVALFDSITGAPRGGETHSAILYLNPLITVLDETKCLGNRTTFLALVVLNGTDFSGPTGTLRDGDDGFGFARELFWFYALAQIRAMRRDNVSLDGLLVERPVGPAQMMGAIATCAHIMSAKPYGDDPFAAHIFAHIYRPGSARSSSDWNDISRETIRFLEPVTFDRSRRQYHVWLPSARSFFTTNNFDAEFLPALATFAYWTSSLTALDGVVCSDGVTPALCRVHLDGMQVYSEERLSGAVAATPSLHAINTASKSEDLASAWTRLIYSAYRQMCMPFASPPINPSAALARPRKRAVASGGTPDAKVPKSSR